MLLVYGALVLGGIETFFVRLIKARAEKGLVTKILLTQPESFSNSELLNQARRYGEVVFIQDLLLGPKSVISYLPKAFYPIYPAKKEALNLLLANVSQIHVSDAYSGIIAANLMKKVNKQIPVTIGFYHSKEFSWGSTRKLPYFEQVNRDFVFSAHSPDNLIIFNESFVNLYLQHGRDLSQANCFPIGVVDQISVEKNDTSVSNTPATLKVVSVGRLVNFKMYNSWMIDLTAALAKSGVAIEYHIYGNGPLEQRLKQRVSSLAIDHLVYFHGPLNYADFDTTIKDFDVFIGSGTAIVQAAALGVVSVVGIENVAQPESYGYFADIPGFSYNEDGLYPKVEVSELLLGYLKMPEQQRQKLKHKHIEKAKIFSMSRCVENFEQVGKEARLRLKDVDVGMGYCMSLLFNVALAKINKNNLLNLKYVD